MDKRVQKKREKLMVNYFYNVKSRLAVVFFVFTLVFLVLSLVFEKGYRQIYAHYGCGALTILCFLMVLLAKLNVFNANLTPEEVEQIIEEDRELAYGGAFDNLMISNNKAEFVSAPVEIVTPEAYPGKKVILYRFDKKLNKIFYSQTGYNWLFFKESYLLNYHVIVNHIHGYVGFEVANEVAYKDIANIMTETKREGGFEKVTMYLNLCNGNQIIIPIRCKKSSSSGSTEDLNEKEKLVLNTIRDAIRKNR